MKLSTFYNHIITSTNQENKTIEQIGEKLLEKGVGGIELLIKKYDEENLNNIKRLQAVGMYVNSIPAHTDIIHGATFDFADEMIRKALNVNTDKIMLIPGFLNEGEDLNDAIDRTLPFTDYLCNKGADYGIIIGLEDYGAVNSPVRNSSGMLRYLENVPKLTCTFDSGNFIFSGEDTYEAYTKLKKYITHHFHCKDHTLTPNGSCDKLVAMNGNDLYPVAIGTGVIPNKEILKDLKQNGFDGAITIEIFGSARMMSDIYQSADFIKQIFF